MCYDEDNGIGDTLFGGCFGVKRCKYHPKHTKKYPSKKKKKDKINNNDSNNETNMNTHLYMEIN